MQLTLSPDVPLFPPLSGEVEMVMGESGDRYRLAARPLGSGAQAEVWLATREDGLRVALKVAHDHATLVEMVCREADLLQALSAAGATCVVPFVDRVNWNGRPGFVMQLCATDLDSHLNSLVSQAGGSGIEAVLEVAGRLSKALAELHAFELPGFNGHIVHRDIKPENVLVDEAGNIRLADLGGSLLVEGQGSVELGVFGSPLWAPFDQMLPGHPEPNATWDTYAVCVMLFWWITQGRPIYQSDPAPMLTSKGREIWETLGEVARAQDVSSRRAATSHLQAARGGTHALDMVDVRGHGAIQPGDVEALRRGVLRLTEVERYGTETVDAVVKSLSELLSRGLSPLSHPSPPNRYWSAGDLAEDIEAIGRRLADARAHTFERSRFASLENTVKAPARRPFLKRGRRPLAAVGVVVAAMLAGMTVAYGLSDGEAPPAEAMEAAAVGEPRSTVDTVLVPGGPYEFGEGFGKGNTRSPETIELSSYRIQRTEVTTRDYLRCVEASVCTTPAWLTAGSPWELGVGKKGKVFAGLTGEAQPIVGVTFQQASTWCAWAGGRLPTGEEWEKAAAGAEGGPKRRWPWGEDPPGCSRAHYGPCEPDGTLPVGSLQGGASSYGALDMAGNAWEWTTSVYPVVYRDHLRRVTTEHRVLRGGAFNSMESSLQPTFQRHLDPDAVSQTHSFRCVFEAE